MQAKQQGFTLVELVVVIVVLGILAATALPKFMDLSGEAGDAAAKAAAGALTSAASMNYAKIAAGGTGTSIVSTTAKCSALNALMTGGALPTDISWATDNTITCSNGIDAASCNVKHAKGATTAGFPVTVMCTG